MITSLLKICLGLMLLAGALMWLSPKPDHESSAESIKALAKTLEQDPELAEKLISRKKITPLSVAEGLNDEDKIGPFFGTTEQELLIKKYLLQPVESKKEIIGEIAKDLAKDPAKSISSINSVYKNMLAYEFNEERSQLLDLTYKMIEADPASEQSQRLIKDFYLDIVETGVDPVEEDDPLGSVSLKAIRYFLSVESDPEERQRIVAKFLQDHPEPMVKNEIERLQNDYRPPQK